MTEISNDLIWWISAVDLPALAGLFWMIWRVRADSEQAIDEIHDELYQFKLDVAKTYASQRDMRAIEKRLIAHLLRIEAKLDATALKTEGLQARSLKQEG
ncbi:MAG: hypothetical protein ACLFP8_08405 [Alphaproteobacteria bacterium]